MYKVILIPATIVLLFYVVYSAIWLIRIVQKDAALNHTEKKVVHYPDDEDEAVIF